MAQFLQDIAQYLQNIPSSIGFNVNKQGTVAESVNPRFKPKAAAGDYVSGSRLGQGISDISALLRGEPNKIQVSGSGNTFEDLGYLSNQPRQVPQQQAQVLGRQAGAIDPRSLDVLENTILPLTRQYGIPDELAAAQWSLESGRGSSEPALYGNNPFGLLWEGEPHYYESLENAVADYDRTLRSIFGYNKGLVAGKGAMPEIDYSQYTPEDLAWTLMFTDLADRRAMEFTSEGTRDPLYGDPNASQYRYEAHSPTPDYVSLLMNTPEWRYYAGR